MCIGEEYGFPEIDELFDEWGYTGHISSRGVDQSKRKRVPGYRARRWVVERTHSWSNRFRRLLVRWKEKKKELRRNATLRMRMGNLARIGNLRQAVLF